MTKIVYDMDGYELFEGDYVACSKKLYRINNVNNEDLELIHVKTTKIVKRKSSEVERLN